jgi:hypothetical protein
VYYEGRPGQGFSSALLGGAAVDDSALGIPPVRDEHHAPAVFGAVRPTAFAYATFEARPSDHRASFGPPLDLVFT